jgi:hypothetical protein
VEYEALSADEPAVRSRRHRLTLGSGPDGDVGKADTSQKPSKVRTRDESAKDPGNYLRRRNTAIVQLLAVTLHTVGKWRQRYLEMGLDGILYGLRPGNSRKLSYY